jgi:tRNA A-37 threonylcarbamoyl transferase component Bud32
MEEPFIEAARLVESLATADDPTGLSPTFLSLEQGRIVLQLHTLRQLPSAETILGRHERPSEVEWTRSWLKCNRPVINGMLELVRIARNAQTPSSLPPLPPLRLVGVEDAARHGRPHLWSLVRPALLLFSGNQVAGLLEIKNRDPASLARATRFVSTPPRAASLAIDKQLIEQLFVQTASPNVVCAAILGDYGQAFVPFELQRERDSSQGVNAPAGSSESRCAAAEGSSDQCKGPVYPPRQYRISFADEATFAELSPGERMPAAANSPESPQQVRWTSDGNMIMSIVRWALYAQLRSQESSPVATHGHIETWICIHVFPASFQAQTRAARPRSGEKHSQGRPPKRNRMSAAQAAADGGAHEGAIASASPDARSSGASSRSARTALKTPDLSSLLIPEGEFARPRKLSASSAVDTSFYASPDRSEDVDEASQTDVSLSSDNFGSVSNASVVPSEPAGRSLPRPGDIGDYLYVALAPFSQSNYANVYRAWRSSCYTQLDPALPQPYLRTVAPSGASSCMVKAPRQTDAGLIAEDEDEWQRSRREDREKDAIRRASYEADAYAALAPLQGVVIPRLLYAGPFELCLQGKIPVLLLEDVGGAPLYAVDPATVVVSDVRAAVVAAYVQLHAAGWCHHDVAQRNIMLLDDGRAVIIDLETARREAEQYAEGEMMMLHEMLNKWESAAPDSDYESY